jgi:hypothetical protein
MSHNGKFEKADSGDNIPVAGRGAAFGDINNDGWQDVVTTALNARPHVLINRGGKQHWLTITLRGTQSNRDGFGARVQVNGKVRFATASGSYLSSNDKRLHFGLATVEKAQIEVVWPSGLRQIIKDARVDQFLQIVEPKR